MIAYTVRPATTTKMPVTIASTRKDSSRMANAGVDAGANMLGVGAIPTTANPRLIPRSRSRGKIQLGASCRSSVPVARAGAAVYVPSRPFFSKNTQSADRALPRGADQEPVGLSRGLEERHGFAG